MKNKKIVIFILSIFIIGCSIVLINKNDSKENVDNEISLNEYFEEIEEVRSYEEKILSNVTVLSQFPNYPTGCEVVSTIMALLYVNEFIEIDDFILKYLPVSNDFYYDELYYGPDPYKYFVGDPTSYLSYGCMSSVIYEALLKYFGNDNYVKKEDNITLEELSEKYINNDYPVIVWTSMFMSEVTYDVGWYLDNDEVYMWPSNEHCMLLIGYDKDNYYFADPYVGEIVKYEKELAEQRYQELGSQAIAIVK